MAGLPDCEDAMESQKLEDCYSEHSSTIFSEMLGEDEDYQRLRKLCRASSAKKHGSNTSP